MLSKILRLAEGGHVLKTLKLGWGHDAHPCSYLFLECQLKEYKIQKSQQILTFGPKFFGAEFFYLKAALQGARSKHVLGGV